MRIWNLEMMNPIDLFKPSWGILHRKNALVLRISFQYQALFINFHKSKFFFMILTDIRNVIQLNLHKTRIQISNQNKSIFLFSPFSLFIAQIHHNYSISFYLLHISPFFLLLMSISILLTKLMISQRVGQEPLLLLSHKAFNSGFLSKDLWEIILNIHP